MTNPIAKRLIERANEIRALPRRIVNFVGEPEADDLLNNIKNYPHLFVLACLMDQQIKAERAWMIPIKIGREVGHFTFDAFAILEADWLQHFFQDKGLHRFNEKTARWFYMGIQHIKNYYENDASRIWQGNLSSAAIVRRFLRFEGAGIKIATMATNMLARDFQVEMSDKISIDISADVHAMRVFYRLGLTSAADDMLDLMYAARELYPEYPGIFDFVVWDIGRNWCYPTAPICSQCYMNDLCIKKDVNKIG
jgi:endonuclease III